MSSTLKQILLWVVGILILLILLAWVVKSCNESEANKNPIPTVATKTDTVYVPDPNYYMDTLLPGRTYIIPNEVIQPYTQVKHDTVTNVTIQHDTVTIGIKDTTLKYDSRFLTKFPLAKKLVMGSFTKDTISLYFLDPDGNQSALVYQTFYDSYNYAYYNNSFHTVPRKITDPTQNSSLALGQYISTESNAAVLFNPITDKPSVMIDYSVMYKQKIGLTSIASYSGGQVPAFSIGIGVRYKIK